MKYFGHNDGHIGTEDAVNGPKVEGDDGNEVGDIRDEAAGDGGGSGMTDDSARVNDGISSIDDRTGPTITRDGLVNPSASGDSRSGWYKFFFHDEKELVVSCYNRVTCGKRFMFQGSSFSEAVNSVYRRVILTRKIDIAVVPQEMRRALDRARFQEREEDIKCNHQVVLRFVATGLFRRETDAHYFCTLITAFGTSKFYSVVWLCARNWYISSHNL